MRSRMPFWVFPSVLLLILILAQGAVPQPPGRGDSGIVPGARPDRSALADSVAGTDGSGGERGDPNDFDHRLIFILSVLATEHLPGF